MHFFCKRFQTISKEAHLHHYLEIVKYSGEQKIDLSQLCTTITSWAVADDDEAEPHNRLYFCAIVAWDFTFKDICFLSTFRQLLQVITNIPRPLRRFFQFQSFSIIFQIHFLGQRPS